MLLCSEMCVYDIATLLGMSQSAISHQLRVLKQMDLVKNRRDGKTIFYALADDHIITILNQGLNHIEEAQSPCRSAVVQITYTQAANTL